MLRVLLDHFLFLFLKSKANYWHSSSWRHILDDIYLDSLSSFQNYLLSLFNEWSTVCSVSLARFMCEILGGIRSLSQNEVFHILAQ